MLDWLKIVPEDLAYRWQKNPLLGRSPPFNWQQFSEKLTAQPGFVDFQVDPDALQLSDDPLREFPKQCTNAQISLSGIQGKIFCLLPLDQSNQLFNWLIGDEALAEIPLKEAFLRYFLSQSLEVVGSIDPLQNFATTLIALEEGISSIDANSAHLFIDLKIRHHEHTLVMRLIFDDLFADSWKNYWADKNGPLLSDLISRDIDVPIQCLAGQTTLSHEEIKDLKVGDWVKLDSHGFDASLKPVQLTLALGNHQVGSALIESNDIKIQEFTSPLTFTSQKPS